METVIAERIGEVEVFRQLARAIHGVVRKNMEGVNQKESLVQPQPEGNCMNWVMGHLLRVYENALLALGQKPMIEGGGFERYKRGGEAMKNPEDAMEITKLMEDWDEATKRLDAGLASLTVELLDEKAPFLPGKDPNETVRTRLTTILFHQGYHAGQLGLLRRIAGKPGAIS